MLRRLALTAVASLAALAAVPGAASAFTGPGSASVPSVSSPVPGPVPGPGPGPAVGQLPGHRVPDRLSVAVTGSGDPAADGTHQLECGPTGGTHPSPQQACDRLARLAVDGKRPFAPVPEGLMCTMLYGGPATAHITGTWQGQPVDATFRRTNGCETSRWNNLEPVLPHTVA
ncbi:MULTISPECIES: SSI family serine proteinase inhibitor [unclassified Streptomyces]|uniref:SSI family serine proteinase inhibitor n=1 Tax=unclassified Streptomyces TaxID=2593676 RepID=UPI0022537AFC|nr:SSI family serine proteinase inhibitor [Streptomyces sp. NBC_01500]MCX4549435.1 subtilase-type protease inhibitor [Streptomyces sp. NBC_01500]WSV54976.1 subtilase-type protease inhibitor [Streptomyces sp. NBC_01014]